MSVELFYGMSTVRTEERIFLDGKDLIWHLEKAYDPILARLESTVQVHSTEAHCALPVWNGYSTK